MRLVELEQGRVRDQDQDIVKLAISGTRTEGVIASLRARQDQLEAKVSYTMDSLLLSQDSYTRVRLVDHSSSGIRSLDNVDSSLGMCD